MSAANWDGGTQAPNPGDDLVFPSGVAQLNSTNDFNPGTAFRALTFTGAGYVLSGAQIRLDAGGVADNAAGNNVLNLDVLLPATRSFTVVTGGQLFLGGAISGNAGGLTKVGAGNLIVSGDNSYGGVTTVSQGVLNVESDAALGLADGTPATGTIVANGAALELQGGITIGFEALSLSGSGIQGAGALRNVSGVNFWQGPITLATDTGIVTENGQLTLQNVISGPGGLSLLRGGAGSELRLTAPDTYTGSTTVSGGGTLRLREGGTIASSQNVSVLGGTLILDNFGDGGSVDFNNNRRLGNNASLTFIGGNLSFIGNDVDDSNQVVGAMNLAGGMTTVRIVNQRGKVATLTGSRLNRSPGATVAFSGDGLDGSGLPTYLGGFFIRILFATPPVVIGPDPFGKLLPYATITTNPAFGPFLATYEPTLNTTFGTIGIDDSVLVSLNTFVPNANVAVTQPFVSVPDPGVTINSLFYFGGNITVTGARLMVASGEILAPGLGNTLNVPVVDFGATEGIVATPDTATFTINSAIAGSRGLTKAGTGQLTLGNLNPDAANTYTGLTTLNAGTLLLSKTNGLIAIPGALVIGDDAGAANAHVVRLTQPNQIAPTASVIVTRSGLLDLNGRANKIGGLTLSNGNVTIGSATLTVAGLITLIGGNITTTTGTLVLGGDVSVPASATTVTLNCNLSLGTVAVGGRTRTFNVASGQAAVGLDIRGTISGSDAGVGLVKSGAGTLHFSSVSNTYQGSTTVTAGTLLLNMPGLVAISGSLIVGTATGPTGQAVVRLLFDGQIGSAAAVVVNSSGLFDLNNNNDTVASLSMTGGSVTTGTGTLTVVGNVAGGTSPSAATIAGNLAMGTGVFTLASGATMTVAAVLSGASGLAKNGAGLLQLTANNVYTGTTTVNGGTLVLASPQVANTFVVNNSGTLVVNGSLPGDNVTVNSGGMLVVNGSLAGSSITVNSGGTLRGTGTVGDVSVATGGLVITGSPPASTGVLTSAGNVALNGTFVVQLNGTTAGTGFNQWFVSSGTLDLTGSTLAITLGFATSTNDTFVLLRKSGVGTITGSFAGLPERTGFTIGNRQFRISYVGGGGHDVVLTTLTSATLTVVTSAPNPTFIGQPVTFTATVTAVSGVGTPTGTVTFKEGTTILGMATLSGGLAAITISSLSPGTHSVIATYSGDSSYDPSTSSSPTIQTVNTFPTTRTALTSSVTVPNLGQPITFTATVTVVSGSGTPTGTVTFFDGTTSLGSATLSGTTAVLTTSSLSLGRHSMTAVYSGDTVFGGSSSPALIQIVGIPNEIFVDQLYRDLLQRPAEAAAVATWRTALDQGHSRTEIAQAILDSPERHRLVVNDMYRTYLRRDPDPGGFSGWVAFLNSGGTVTQLRIFFTGSDEYFQNRGRLTTDGFLEALYSDALNRPPDSLGRLIFMQALASGASHGQVAEAVFRSPEYRQVLVQSFYSQFLHRRADNTGLNIFVGALQSGARDENVIAAIVGSGEYFNRL